MADDPTTWKIEITKDGPYVVTGPVPLTVETIVTDERGESIDWRTEKTYEAKSRYALCRCGQSANKPYCDGTHKNVGWSDSTGG